MGELTIEIPAEHAECFQSRLLEELQSDAERMGGYPDRGEYIEAVRVMQQRIDLLDSLGWSGTRAPALTGDRELLTESIRYALEYASERTQETIERHSDDGPGRRSLIAEMSWLSETLDSLDAEAVAV